MGSRSKAKRKRTYRSSRTVREWCAARGISFAIYMRQFPLLACNFTIPIVPVQLKPSLWAKIKDFICRLIQKSPK